MAPYQSAIRNPQSVILDQLGKEIPLPTAPLRIVSAVPSQTELLFSLGLEEEVVGITKFCIHPDHWFRSKTRVGGTKQLNIDRIRSLQPNLVIANKEENTLEDAMAIEAFCPVWTSDISSISDALDMINRIGDFTGTIEKSSAMVNKIRREFSAIPNARKFRSAYLIWKNPWMAAGGGTFINDMLNTCGMKNVLEDRERYPSLEIGSLVEEGIEILFLSSEPYPFKMNDLEQLSRILPEVKIILVDGELFSWYGSRMLQAPAYFRRLREQLEG
jgi:ABC-type Fe3+-hydroxamate transport system substrate-binding protein